MCFHHAIRYIASFAIYTLNEVEINKLSINEEWNSDNMYIILSEVNNNLNDKDVKYIHKYPIQYSQLLQMFTTW